MTVRPLQGLSAYFQLHTALWFDSAANFELEVAEILQAEHRAAFVAEQEGELVGFVEASLRSYAEGCDSIPVGYPEGWYVTPQYRQTGVGRWLVQAAEGWARAKSCTDMASDSELSNTQSHQAHAHQGNQEVERIVCFRKAL